MSSGRRCPITSRKLPIDSGDNAFVKTIPPPVKNFMAQRRFWRGLRHPLKIPFFCQFFCLIYEIFRDGYFAGRLSATSLGGFN
jgi:hypothetical protein